MHAPGSTVRITRDNYREERGRDFTGLTGAVRTANENGVTIVGLDPSSELSYWFYNDEVEPA